MMWRGRLSGLKQAATINVQVGIFALLLTASILLPGTANAITRLSVGPTGVQANEASFNPSISSDGRYIAFESKAGNLVAGDSNGKRDIFVHDVQTGETERVSLNSSGMQANDSSFNAAISADGRYVAFDSKASNLVANDNNGVSDVFVHDRQTGTTIRVSVDSAGVEGLMDSWNPAISADGRYIAFESLANNLVPGDTNEKFDVFVHDMQTGETVRASVNSAGAQSAFVSWNPSISGDGRYVSFDSVANDLVAGDMNGKFDIFVHDMQTGSTERVSLSSTGAQGDEDSMFSAISADGRYVAFGSTATNLVTGDTNNTWDIFVHDRQTGETIRVSVDSTGLEGVQDSWHPSISALGRYIAFESSADNLVAGDSNLASDIFVHDRQTGETKRLSVDDTGIEGNGPSSAAAISAYGACVAFESDASNLVANDTNIATDVFLVQCSDTTPPVISAPASITVEATGVTTVVTALDVVSAQDDVDGPVPVSSDAPAAFPLGTTIVTFTATDAAGNTASATVEVIVQDTTPPVLSVPADVSANSMDGNPVAVNIGQATATDIFSVTISNDAPAAFPVGQTIVTWTATDANGNAATGTQLVTVVYVDSVPPVVSAPPDVIVEATGMTTMVSLGTATATDNVDGSVTVSSDAPAAFPLGITVVTYTASDAAGNIGTATQNVTVQDTTAPVITAPGPVDASSPDGNPVPVAIGQPSATDIFNPVTVINDAPAVFPVGSTLVTWTATDTNNNSANAYQVVSVADDRSIPGLPPDPGPAGRATLEGIDSDGDGVRDDVQRWIAINFPDSEKTRAALTQRTITMQQFLLDAADPTITLNNALEMGRGIDCLYYVDSANAYDISRKHKAVFLNTYLRSRTWLQADHHLSGGFFSGSNEWKQGCNFDPDAMPN